MQSADWLSLIELWPGHLCNIQPICFFGGKIRTWSYTSRTLNSFWYSIPDIIGSFYLISISVTIYIIIQYRQHASMVFWVGRRRGSQCDKDPHIYISYNIYNYTIYTVYIIHHISMVFVGWEKKRQPVWQREILCCFCPTVTSRTVSMPTNLFLFSITTCFAM